VLFQNKLGRSLSPFPPKSLVKFFFFLPLPHVPSSLSAFTCAPCLPHSPIPLGRPWYTFQYSLFRRNFLYQKVLFILPSPYGDQILPGGIPFDSAFFLLHTNPQCLRASQFSDLRSLPPVNMIPCHFSLIFTFRPFLIFSLVLPSRDALSPAWYV